MKPDQTTAESLPEQAARSRIGSDVLDPAMKVSRAGRFDTMEALHALEDALDAPTPRRERTWLHRVLAAVDTARNELRNRGLITVELGATGDKGGRRPLIPHAV